MMEKPVKILLLADTHLGFDLPLQPRIERRRRGEDFFANYQLILDFARRKQVDLIVHGGDLFFRSKVSPAIIDKAYQPLFDLANAGIPIYIVPGNHERSRLPEHLFLAHERIQVFDQPVTLVQQIGDKQIALSGFPFTRNVRERFPELLAQTGWEGIQADAHLLCAHQTFEGAQVGPVDFTFREGPDNIPPEWVPGKFTAVLSGHIHRAQQLTQSLSGEPLSVPIIYPGSIERTSVAERFEEKSFNLIQLAWKGGRPNLEVETHPLPIRPMVKVTLPVENFPPDQVLVQIRDRLSLLKPDAVVRVELTGPRAEGVQRLISAASLRAAAPGSMNITFGLKLERAGGK
jgi:DNA repair exonuclease SbcCD nuclease subunit